jgi:hypothetical protein
MYTCQLFGTEDLFRVSYPPIKCPILRHALFFQASASRFSKEYEEQIDELNPDL